MWRTRAVITMLLEEVCSLAGEDDAGEGAGSLAALAKARRRAGLVVALEALAVLVLVLARDPAAPFLTLGPTEGTIFTLAILAVAVHAGFRLGQLEKYTAVERAVRDLAERSEAAGDPAS